MIREDVFFDKDLNAWYYMIEVRGCKVYYSDYFGPYNSRVEAEIALEQHDKGGANGR